MLDKLGSQNYSRVAHYFRDVDSSRKSCPKYMPESFAPSCYVEEPFWPSRFLLRVALRFHHIWATPGSEGGDAKDAQPGVSFSAFNVADLVALTNGSEPADEHATQYAITFTLRAAESAGMARVQSSQPEWRWPYTGNYRRAIAKIEADGFEGNTIPGLDLTQEHWAGVGIVVATRSDAIRLQYDILSLIDEGIVSVNHFDHLLVCEQLPRSCEGLTEPEIQEAVDAACFDFRACMNISHESAAAARKDFADRLCALELSTPRARVQEQGGCWVSFDDNTHPYVRALLKAGRVVVNQEGRYLGTLDEVNPRRDLGERQKIAEVLSQQLQEEHGVACGYYCVGKSWDPSGLPSYAGRPWSGMHRITDEPDDEDVV